MRKLDLCNVTNCHRFTLITLVFKLEYHARVIYYDKILPLWMVFYAFGNTYQQIMKRIEYFESKLLQIRSSRLTQVGRTAEPILIQSAELN